MEAYYLKRHEADLPAHLRWLSPAESRILASLEVPKRRQDWLLGRWTAKCALQRLPGIPASPSHQWQILPEASGRPVAALRGEPQDIALSISHSHGQALCALATNGGAVGCDLERIEERGEMFMETYFTPSERALVNRPGDHSPAVLATLLWCAKESVLKLLGEGLRADTYRVEVGPIATANGEDWSRVRVTDRLSGEVYGGRWSRCGEMVLCIMGEQPLIHTTPIT